MYLAVMRYTQTSNSEFVIALSFKYVPPAHSGVFYRCAHTHPFNLEYQDSKLHCDSVKILNYKKYTKIYLIKYNKSDTWILTFWGVEKHFGGRAGEKDKTWEKLNNYSDVAADPSML